MLKLECIEQKLLKDCNDKTLTQRQVYEKYNISRTALQTFLKRRGLKWSLRPDPKKINFTPEEINDLVQNYLNGISLVNLGLRFGCGDAVIKRILNKEGIETSREKKHRDVLQLMEQNKEGIINSYTNDKISAIKIAQKLGVTPSTLYRYLKRWRIQVVDRNKRLDVREHKDDIIRMYDEKYSMSEICEIFKCDGSCINKCLKEWGFEPTHKRTGVGTYIENRVEKFLIEQNITYQKQFKLERSKFDFYIPSARLFIETHGDYWHGNPKIYSQLDDIQRFKKNLDRKKRKIAKVYGYNYIWVWGTDIKNNFNKVKIKILNDIRKFENIY